MALAGAPNARGRRKGHSTKGRNVDISRKTDYSLRMLAELVRSDGVVSVRAAAEKNGIPYSFARSIQHDQACACAWTRAR